ncbi:MAG: sugar-binding domain-containing protein [Nocardioidaceae bacterium]|nr:sugar-binding domain-containing protein [Nocardioidaceae bacterium]
MARAAARPPSASQERLAAQVARLYHVWGRRQKEIATALSISQTTVSRVLAAAEATSVVHKSVQVPADYHPELEDALEARFDLRAAHVVEVGVGESLTRSLGQEAADYLRAAPLAVGTVGFTSWSTTLREMVAALGSGAPGRSGTVVEMLGDLGSPALQHAAARSTQQLARLLGAEPVFLRTPGVFATADLRASAVRTPHMLRATQELDRLDVAFVGVGPVDVHSFLTPDDNFFSSDQLAAARAAGGVGQLDQRAIDARGERVDCDLDDLVVAVSLDQLRRCPRRITVAGGTDKVEPLRAALCGGWIHELFTDAGTATALLAPRIDAAEVLAT